MIDLVAESAGYLKMFEAKKWDENLDYSKNLSQFKSEFFADFPREKVKKLEDLRKNNRFLFEELISVADFDSLMAEGDSPEYSQNLQLIKKYKEWISLEQRSEEISHFLASNIFKYPADSATRSIKPEIPAQLFSLFIKFGLLNCPVKYLVLTAIFSLIFFREVVNASACSGDKSFKKSDSDFLEAI